MAVEHLRNKFFCPCVWHLPEGDLGQGIYPRATAGFSNFVSGYMGEKVVHRALEPPLVQAYRTLSNNVTMITAIELVNELFIIL